MTRSRVCPECGVEVAPDGVCPKCAFSAGLEDAPSASIDPGSGAVSTQYPRDFGNYELLEEIARGGMGIVLKARQKRLDRVVAVKLVLSRPLTSAENIERFRVEAQLAARLQHPGIVAIHEVGEHEGQHFFSMDYVAGCSLADLLRDGPLPAVRAARYLRDIAQAVQYAHAQGILHRDLKPSNVLIDSSDQPRITDFGLAKEIAGQTELTLSGQILGSPNFMPPEQAAGKRAKIGPYSDVYSLGAILYQTLTGRPPFVAETITDTLHQVVNTEPLPPRALNPSVPRDLETICLKCLEKEPARRYPTARALAEELDRILRGDSILARPLGPAEKTWRWCGRKPALASWIGASLLLFALGATGVFWQWRRAVQGERTARKNLYAADMNLAQQALAENNLGRATELLARHFPARAGALPSVEPGGDLRGWEWRYLWGQCRADELFVLSRRSGWVGELAFSPDGRFLATTGDERQIRLWDLTSRRPMASFTYAEFIAALAYAPDGRHVACASSVAPVRLLAAPTLSNRFELAHTASALAFSEDGKALYSARSGEIKRWDVESGRLMWQSGGEGLFQVRGVNSQIALSADGARVAAGSFEQGVRVWETASGTEIAAFPREADAFVYRLAFSPDGKTLAVGHTEGTVKLWSLSDRRLLHTLAGHASWITALAFAPDGSRLASASYDHAIVLWDLATDRKLNWLKGHEDEIDALAFSPDGQKLASGSKDQTVRLWDATTSREADSWKRYAGPAFPCTLSPDGGSAMVFDLENRAFMIWDVPSLRMIAAPPITGTNLTMGVASANRHFIAIGTKSGTIKLLAGSEPNRAPIREFPTGADDVDTLAFSHAGNLLASGSKDGRVAIWNINTGTRIAELDHLAENVEHLSFSPDDRFLKVGYGGQSVGELFDVSQRRRIALFAGHHGSILAIAVSHRGHLAATGSFDHTVKLWRLGGPNGATELATLKGHLTPVWSVAFSQDDTRLAVGLGGGEIRIWNVETRQEVATLRGHQLPVLALHFTARDDTLVSVGGDSIHVWKAAPLDQFERPRSGLIDSP